MKIPHVGEAELAVMQVLWQADRPLSTADINRAVEAYGWKRTTVSTFLTRLLEKKAITAQKQGAQYYYTPILTKAAYQRAQTGALVHSLFGGSVTALAASLFEDTALTADEIQELRAILERSAQ